MQNDLISRSALKAAVASMNNNLSGVQMLIDNAPAVDAVQIESLDGKMIKAAWQKQDGVVVEFLPVVRCKDCKHKRHLQGAKDEANVCGLGWGLSGIVAEEDFCSYGERRVDDG